MIIPFYTKEITNHLLLHVKFRHQVFHHAHRTAWLFCSYVLTQPRSVFVKQMSSISLAIKEHHENLCKDNQ